MNGTKIKELVFLSIIILFFVQSTSLHANSSEGHVAGMEAENDPYVGYWELKYGADNSRWFDIQYPFSKYIKEHQLISIRKTFMDEYEICFCNDETFECDETKGIKLFTAGSDYYQGQKRENVLIYKNPEWPREINLINIYQRDADTIYFQYREKNVIRPKIFSDYSLSIAQRVPEPGLIESGLE